MSEIYEIYNLGLLPQIVTDQAMNLSSAVLPPLCQGGKIIDAKFAPHHIGDSPGGVIHYITGSTQTWTQLPGRVDELKFIEKGVIVTGGEAENMYNQYGWVMRFLFPNLVHFDPEKRMLVVDTEGFGRAILENDERITQIYSDWTVIVDGALSIDETPEQILDRYKTPAWAAAGLYYLLGAPWAEFAPIIKGQFTGPVSWGITIEDQSGRPIIFDEQVYDVLARALILQAFWQLRALEKFKKPVIIQADEPALTSSGSEIPQIHRWLNLMLDAFQDHYLAVHVGGQVDYDLLVKAESPPRILSLDLTGPGWDGSRETADYANYFLAWVRQNTETFNNFLNRSFIALGVIPFNTSITADEIVKHVQMVADQCIQAGVMLTPDKCFITPTCGAGSQPVEVAQDTSKKLMEVPYRLQLEYRLDR